MIETGLPPAGTSGHRLEATILPVIIGVCGVALLAPLAWPLVTGRVFMYGDLFDFHLPVRSLYQDALVSDDSLLWTPSIYSGYYIHGEGQAGMYHPLHQLLYRAFPLGAAFNLELLANYLTAFPGMYLLLRRLRIGTNGSLAGALLFAFGGFNVLHHDHLNLVAGVVHIPWLLLATDILVRAERGSSLAAGYAAVALVIASEALLGFPQGLWFSLLTVCAFAVFRAPPTGRRTRLALFGCALATGALLGGIQLLPTIDTAVSSLRPSLPREFTSTYSLHPLNVLQFWSPYVFTHRVYPPAEVSLVQEFGVYDGAFVLAALPWLWIRRHALGDRRSLVLAAGAMAALSLVLAFGKYGGLHIVLSQLPGLKWLRAPARYIVLTQLSLAFLAALAFDELEAARRDRTPAAPRRQWLLWLPAGLSVLTTLALNSRLVPVAAERAFSLMPRAAVGNLLFLIVTALVVLAARRVRWALPALVVVTAVDLGMWGIREVWRRSPQPLESLITVDSSEPHARRRVFMMFHTNFLVLRGYRLTSGYTALPPATRLDLSSVTSQQLSGTYWKYTSSGMEPVDGAVDRARLLVDTRVTRDFTKDAAQVDLHRTALVDREIPPLAGPPGSAQVVIDRPGHLVVDVEAPGRQLLALTERHHPGWQARADGGSLEMVRVHGDFLGAVVEGGTDRVEFRFMPRSFVLGVAASLIGMVLLAVAVVWIVR